jgi:hypothetical protein
VTIVSDTNILSSLVAANALTLLQQLFIRSMLSIPPAVRDELRNSVWLFSRPGDADDNESIKKAEARLAMGA